MKNKAKLFVCIFMLFCFVLSATNKIKVGWPLIQGLQEYDENSNSYSGFNYDYLKEIAKYNNVNAKKYWQQTA